MREAADQFEQRALAKAAGISLQHLSSVLTDCASPSGKILTRIARGAETLRHDSTEAGVREGAILQRVREACKEMGLQRFAQ